MTSELPPRRGAATRKGAGTTLGRLIQRRAAMLLKPAIEQAIRQIVAVLHDFHPADRKWLVKALVEDVRFAPLLPDAPGTPPQTCAAGSVQTTGQVFTNWPDPTLEMLDDPRFEAIWQAIKSWDIHVPGAYGGYCGATGNHVRAILDKLSASPSPPVIESGWQDISTAPKDGREVLLRRDGMVIAAFYGRGELSANAGASKRHPWVVLDHTNGLNHVREDWASHWMPLPSPAELHRESQTVGGESGADASSLKTSQAIASGDEVIPSSGCVFCELRLEATHCTDGWFHLLKEGRAIACNVLNASATADRPPSAVTKESSDG
jgi:hypothetical protein